QMVLLSVGVKPDTGFLKDSGIVLDERGSIEVNRQLQTNMADVYAGGDAVKIPNLVTKEATMIALAGPANRQGRLIADHIAGLEIDYQGALGTAIMKLFDMTVATTGINESGAKKAGIPYEKLLISSAPHAGYYPGGRNMFIKVLWHEQDHHILGAQIVGFNGVDKRIDVLATAITLGAKVTDLSKLNLAYAPPFGSGKDPINMVGYVAENIIAGRVKQAFWNELDVIQRDGSALLLDVRTDEEAQQGMIPGAIHIPFDELREQCEKLPKDKKIYIYCFSGVRSYSAVRYLEEMGYSAYNISGGWSAFEKMAAEKLKEKQ
ncbi:MAG: FAD-dependent oxidoreductase, partial [Clostridiales bacterium]|nr:FAD-dependent oxidoreductase [Clostridiales bacterium]